MPKIHRLKKSFTAGEIGGILGSRVDNDRYKNGCWALENMLVKSQGPVIRRSGTKFIYDLTSLLDSAGITDVNPRLVPFIFDATHSYVLVFYKHNSGATRVVFATEEGLVSDPDAPDDPYVFEFTGTMDTETFDYAQSADFLYIVQPTRTPVQFKRLASDNWEATEITFRDRPFVMNKVIGLTVASSGTTGSVTLTASASLFTELFVGTEIKLNSGRATITAYTDETHVTATVTVDLTAGTATDQWSTPDWGVLQGYPTRIGFYEQRICYASNLARPQTIWLSKSGDYEDFSTSSPIVSSDACTFTFDSSTQNKIVWMNPARQLLFGTLGDEWTVSGAGSDPLSFSSVRASRHTNSGGEPLKPLMVGVITLFLERLGRRVNQFVYDYYSDSYSTVDLSVLAPHLTDNYTITNWDYQQTPNGIVWCTRSDGVLLGLTFKREHNVTGWHRHTTDGLFLDVCCVPGIKRETELWTIVSRVIGGITKWYIEKFETEFNGTTTSEGRFLDCHRVYEGDPATTITGLEYLEGETVGVLSDGAVHPSRVVTSASITLERPGSLVVVGLSFGSEVQPALEEVGLRDGTNLCRDQRSVHIDVMVDKSVGFQYGVIDREGVEHVEEEPFRFAGDIAGSPVPLFTGVKRVPMIEGWSNDPRVIIRQVKPLPLTVVGLVDHIVITE